MTCNESFERTSYTSYEKIEVLYATPTLKLAYLHTRSSANWIVVVGLPTVRLRAEEQNSSGL